MRYQLVFQFTAEGITDFHELIAVEERLIEQLNDLGSVDGHDFGKSEFNIFVVTDDPSAAFEKAQNVMPNESVRCNMRAGYRQMHNEAYVILWPPSLTEFSIA